MKLYQVGGSIRDELLGIKSKDIDYAVEAESFDAMREGVLALGCEIFLEKPEYYTIRALWNKEAVDFTLCRKDGEYSDGRRPDSVTMGTLADDLARRDFTVNAIAKNLDGSYIDPYDGQADIQKKLLRCVGSTDRLREDALRILRAFRFAICKNFTFDSELEEVLKDKELYSLLSAVSVERKREELNKMMKHDTIASMRLLNKYPKELMDAIFSHGLWLEPTNKKVKK